MTRGIRGSRKSYVLEATATLVAGIFGVWLDRGLSGGGWRIPLAAAFVGGAVTAIGHSAFERIYLRLRRAAQEAEEREPFARLTPRPGEREIKRSTQQPARRARGTDT